MNFRLWRRFFAPAKTPLVILFLCYSTVMGIFAVIEFLCIAAGGITPAPIFYWTMIYPGRAAVICGVLYGTVFGCIKLRKHYLHCKNEAYKEEHNIPGYCERGYEHRLYHTTGNDCPCL